MENKIYCNAKKNILKFLDLQKKLVFKFYVFMIFYSCVTDKYSVNNSLLETKNREIENLNRQLENLRNNYENKSIKSVKLSKIQSKQDDILPANENQESNTEINNLNKQLSIYQKYSKLDLSGECYAIIEELEKRREEAFKKEDLEYISEKLEILIPPKENILNYETSEGTCTICYSPLIEQRKYLITSCNKTNIHTNCFNKSIQTCMGKCPFCKKDECMQKSQIVHIENYKEVSFALFIKNFLSQYQDKWSNEEFKIKNKVDFFYYNKLLLDEIYYICRELNIVVLDYKDLIPFFNTLTNSEVLYNALKQNEFSPYYRNILKIAVFFVHIVYLDNSDATENLKIVLEIIDNALRGVMNLENSSQDLEKNYVRNAIFTFLERFSLAITQYKISEIEEIVVKDKKFSENLLKELKEIFDLYKNFPIEKTLGDISKTEENDLKEKIFEKINMGKNLKNLRNIILSLLLLTNHSLFSANAIFGLNEYHNNP